MSIKYQCVSVSLPSLLFLPFLQSLPPSMESQVSDLPELKKAQLAAWSHLLVDLTTPPTQLHFHQWALLRHIPLLCRLSISHSSSLFSYSLSFLVTVTLELLFLSLPYSLSPFPNLKRKAGSGVAFG